MTGSIINNLSSGDEERHREAMEASEKFMKWKENQTLTWTKYDKTLVNTEKKGSFKVRILIVNTFLISGSQFHWQGELTQEPWDQFTSIGIILLHIWS